MWVRFPSILGRFPGGGNGNPLQYSCLESPMNRGAWQATVHRVAQSWTQLKQLSTAHLPWSDGTGCRDLSFLTIWGMFRVVWPQTDLSFWMLSFKSLSHSPFTFIKRFFNSSSLSVTRVITYAYLRLLIFLLKILIPACASSSPASHMMYSAYK